MITEAGVDQWYRLDDDPSTAPEVRKFGDRRARATTLTAPFATLAIRAWGASQEYTSAVTASEDVAFGVVGGVRV
ncbi:hypothetical protein C0Q98_00585 [Streptomyces albidoflavus]|uniref:Uncharacterized protein n=2 Tax=Streptomyces TaxID=1883 RepID=A0A126Y0Q3_9ACTN|nr:hypothetical protein Salbus254_6152 [Streptomyces albidoflavus]KDR64003.1 hypothetical protein DC60_30875 [Streptomyces wadayamensis]KPC69200.1 hypothetical protein ADL27_54630 [Streptomyces sp. NRRL F-6602]MYX50212.1 hypothetical protein [Streptomyces sp. SID8385]SCE19723.1 hypothetical protein GA0115236_139428 [Streptomyces sp. IgraMP-1]